MISGTVPQDAGVAPTLAQRAAPQIGRLDGAVAAFGLSAAITIVFDTVLAWVKDAYEPLNSFMASLTGHHWTTHGLVDVAVFLTVGVLFMTSGARMDALKLAGLVSGAVIVGGVGLALWFLIV